MENRYRNAIDNLIGAFIKGTLNHGGSCSCAIGNLCNRSVLWKSEVNNWYKTIEPMYLIGFEESLLKQRRNDYNIAGYNGYELVAIENAFEGRQFSSIETTDSFEKGSVPVKTVYFSNFLDYEDEPYRLDPDGFKGLQYAAEVLYQLDADKEETVDLYELCGR